MPNTGNLSTRRVSPSGMAKIQKPMIISILNAAEPTIVPKIILNLLITNGDRTQNISITIPPSRTFKLLPAQRCPLSVPELKLVIWQNRANIFSSIRFFLIFTWSEISSNKTATDNFNNVQNNFWRWWSKGHKRQVCFKWFLMPFVQL